MKALVNNITCKIWLELSLAPRVVRQHIGSNLSALGAKASIANVAVVDTFTGQMLSMLLLILSTFACLNRLTFYYDFIFLIVLAGFEPSTAGSVVNCLPLPPGLAREP